MKDGIKKWDYSIEEYYSIEELEEFVKDGIVSDIMSSTEICEEDAIEIANNIKFHQFVSVEYEPSEGGRVKVVEDPRDKEIKSLKDRLGVITGTTVMTLMVQRFI